MKRTTLILNRRTGCLEFLSPPPFRTEQIHKERFSEIVPANPVKRWVFRLLRWAFGEEGRVSNWTRAWTCVWTAQILLGEHKGETYTHPLRAWCVEWEYKRFAERKPKQG